MSVYVDTSVLVSLYTKDSNTPDAIDVFRETSKPVLLTAFGEAEFLNAIELRVFRKEVTPAQAEEALGEFQKDIRVASFLAICAVPVNSYERAQLLSRHHTRQIGCRGMDVIHVAIAAELKVSTFLTFDKTQAKLAKRAGLTVRPGR